MLVQDSFINNNNQNPEALLREENKQIRMVRRFGHLALIDFVMSQFDPGDFRCADSGSVTSKIESVTKTYKQRKATRIFFVQSDQRGSFERVARTLKIHPTSHQHLKIIPLKYLNISPQSRKIA